MNKYKVMTIIGARPQFIKAAIVSKHLAKKKYLTEIIVHTGQHFNKNMSNIFFTQLNIPSPKYLLKTGGGKHNKMISAIIYEVDKIIELEKPSLILVYGDTNSTLAGALAAKKANINIAHIEAGVRNLDEKMPEEINRYITDRISNLNFCVTKKNLANLKNEGFGKSIPYSKAILTGDVMYDIFLEKYEKIKKKKFNYFDDKIISNNFVLCTIHRASNVDIAANLNEIVQALNKIHKKIPIIFLVHPRTLTSLKKNNINLETITEKPLGYEEVIFYLSKCKFVITDSGGITEETTLLDVPCMTIRDSTERPETVILGSNELLGTNVKAIRGAMNKLFNNEWKKATIPPKWDGRSAQRIIDVLLKI